MLLEILFINDETGDVNYAITNVSRVRYITPSEIGFDKNGRSSSCAFSHTERLEVGHKTYSPMREALMRRGL